MPAKSSTALAAALAAESHWLRKMARALVGDSDADDLVQDAMEAALKSPPETDRPLRPWLRTVTKNAARMRFRSSSRRRKLEASAISLSEHAEDAGDALGKLQLHRDLVQAVIDLDDPYRETIVLRYVDGLKAVDIASKQGVPAATVRSRVKRGLEMLRSELDRNYEGDRNRWQHAMVPLLIPTTAPTTGAIITGVLLMKLTTAVAAAAVAVGLTVALWPSDEQAAAAGPPPDASNAAEHHAAGDVAQPPREAANAPNARPQRPGVRRFESPDARRQFAAAIAKQKARREQGAPSAPPSDSAPGNKTSRALAQGKLDKEYIRERIGEIIPLVRECYELALIDTPNLSGALTVEFVIDAEEEVGGYVREAKVPEDSSLHHPVLSECMLETILSIEFEAPEGGGEVTVRYPFRFRTAEPSGE